MPRLPAATATNFEKQHQHVLRAIRAIIEQRPELDGAWFIGIPYLAEDGTSRPSYDITARWALVRSIPSSRVAALMPDSFRPDPLGLESVFDFGAICADFELSVILIHSATCSSCSSAASGGRFMPLLSAAISGSPCEAPAQVWRRRPTRHKGLRIDRRHPASARQPNLGLPHTNPKMLTTARG